MTNRIAAVLLALTTLSGLVACGAPPEPTAQAVDDTSVPFGLLDRDAPPLLTPTGQDTERASLCFVRGDKLAVIDTTLERPANPTTVVDALVEPPKDAGASLRTAIGPPPLVAGIRLEAGVAEIDLRPAITDLAGDEQLLAVAQLVCTLTNQPGIGTVSFTLEGAPIDVPRGDGSLTSAPVSRDDYRSLLD